MKEINIEIPEGSRIQSIDIKSDSIKVILSDCPHLKYTPVDSKYDWSKYEESAQDPGTFSVHMTPEEPLIQTIGLFKKKKKGDRYE